MALKHLKKNYIQIQNQYIGLKRRVKEFDECVKRGEASPEQAEQARQMFFKVEDNYLRWSYLFFLLDMPVDKKKQEIYLRQHPELAKFFKPYSASTIIEDNTYVLKDFERLLKEVKNYGK